MDYRLELSESGRKWTKKAEAGYYRRKMLLWFGVGLVIFEVLAIILDVTLSFSRGASPQWEKFLTAAELTPLFIAGILIYGGKLNLWASSPIFPEYYFIELNEKGIRYFLGKRKRDALKQFRKMWSDKEQQYAKTYLVEDLQSLRIDLHNVMVGLKKNKEKMIDLSGVQLRERVMIGRAIVQWAREKGLEVSISPSFDRIQKNFRSKPTKKDLKKV
ncbi:hypothetical protein [Algivirga pacifica]|uniref:Uncharacterized protein n=1 Tax=Algivirga pacifica TaxID=1162670 RepID=A0ABP9CYC3_9BACT